MFVDDNAVDLLHPQYHDDDDDTTDGEDSMDEEHDSDNDHSHHGSNRHDHSPISKNQSDGGAKSVEDSADTSTQPGTTTTALPSHVSSPTRPPLPNSTSSFRQHPPNQPMSRPMTPVGTGGLTPRTPPPNVGNPQFRLSPPSPPGRQFVGGLGKQRQQQLKQMFPPSSSQQQQQQQPSQSRSNSSGMTLPPPSSVPPGIGRPPNPLATPVHSNNGIVSQSGRFVPHVVTISLDATPVLETTEVPTTQTCGGCNSSGNNNNNNSSGGSMPATPTTMTTLSIPGRGAYATSQANGGSGLNATRPHSRKLRPRLGQLLEACPLDGAKASAVTCVKFSPSTDFCLIGYGVRVPVIEDHHGNQYHPVTALHRIRGGMTHVSTMLSGDDDINIALFHPDSEYIFVYGTKQGRVRVMGPRPWNYYNC